MSDSEWEDVGDWEQVKGPAPLDWSDAEVVDVDAVSLVDSTLSLRSNESEPSATSTTQQAAAHSQCQPTIKPTTTTPTTTTPTPTPTTTTRTHEQAGERQQIPIPIPRDVYSCHQCGLQITTPPCIVDDRFRAFDSPAFLLNAASNLSFSSKKLMQFTSGKYEVSYARCRQCDEELGWKYLKAFVHENKFKESYFCLAQPRLRLRVGVAAV